MANTGQSFNFLLAGIKGAESGTVTTFVTGTTTPKNVYTSADLSTGATTSITLDSNGAVAGSTVYYGKGLYRIVIKDSDSVTLYTKDGVVFGSNASFDMSSYVDLEAAVADIGATEGDLIIHSAFNVDAAGGATITVPATLRLVFQRGGSLVFGVGAEKVILNGSMDVDRWQIFDSAGSGDVTIGALINETYPEWWGIDGTADEIEINLAWDAVTSSDGGKISLNPGFVYTCANPITWIPTQSLTELIWEGNHATISSTSATDIVTMGHATFSISKCRFQNIYLLNPTGGTRVKSGLRLVGLGISEKTIMSDIYINGVDSPTDSMGIFFDITANGGHYANWENIMVNGFHVGISWGRDFDGDAWSAATDISANDHTWFGLHVQTYTEYGLYLGHVGGLQIYGAEINSGTSGATDIHIAYQNAGTNSGSNITLHATTNSGATKALEIEAGTSSNRIFIDTFNGTVTDNNTATNKNYIVQTISGNSTTIHDGIEIYALRSTDDETSSIFVRSALRYEPHTFADIDLSNIKVTFFDNGTSEDTCVLDSSTWLLQGFNVGDIITITNTASNNVTATITALDGVTLNVVTCTFASEVDAVVGLIVSTTPNTRTSNSFLTGTTAATYTALYNDALLDGPGREITILSMGAITFDTTGNARLLGSSANIVTAAGDITRWLCTKAGTTEGIWTLMSFVDSSADNSTGA